MSAGRTHALAVIAILVGVACRGERARPATDGAASVDADTHGPCPPEGAGTCSRATTSSSRMLLVVIRTSRRGGVALAGVD